MEPEVTPATSATNRVVLIVIILLLLAVVIGLGYFLYTRYMISSGGAITTYEECVQSVGSQLVGEGVCQTNDGRTFSLPPTPDGTTPVITPDFTPVPVPVVIQDCPQEWIIEMEQSLNPPQAINSDGQPIAQGTSYIQADEYLIINGQRYTKAQVDLTWIDQNC